MDAGREPALIVEPPPSTQLALGTNPPTTHLPRPEGVRFLTRPHLFIAGMRNVELVGSCQRIEEPEAPVWSSVHLEYVEALGGGILAYDESARVIRPHIHVSVGLKTHSASGYTSHLLGATVQFLTGMYVVEVDHPTWKRTPSPALYDVPLLTFGA